MITVPAVIEFIIGLIGIVSASAGVAAWFTALSIKGDIEKVLLIQKQDLVSVRRRVKLLENFAIGRGFQAKAQEDTDL